MKHIFIIIFILISFEVSAQKKYDNFFLLGDYISPDTINIPQQGGISIDFSNGNPITYRKDRQMTFNRDIAIMCNDTGKILFYTNGIYINDARDSVMENGDTISPGNKDFLNYTDRLDGGWLPRASLIVPIPNNKYYLFHTDFKLDKNKVYQPAQIKVSTIDLNYNNGLGKVTKKGEILWDVGPYEVQGLLSATQHANGRDWWIMTNTYPYNKYISYLATPDNVYGPFIQEFGYFDNSVGKGNGGLVFSPDGSKLAYTNLYGGFVLFDFDRCTGKLSNYRKFPFGAIPSSVYGNIIFSPNSKYLYVTTGLLLWQLNTDDPNMINSAVKVDTVDGFKDPFLNSFNMMALGPNGKIYMCAGNGVKHLHVIHQPNEFGKACDFKQHDLSTKGITFGFGMPNIPNYRLGALENSPCDTLRHEATNNNDLNTEFKFQLKVFPNPTNSFMKIDITIPQYDPTIKTEVVVVDVSGAIVMRHVMPDFAYIAELDISKLPSGVYGVQLRQPQKSGTRVLVTEKLVVID